MKKNLKLSPKRSDLFHLGSLITYLNQGVETCLGYLLHSPEHGTFEPNFGRMDVTREEAEAHNKALSFAEVQGLKDACQIGQGANFYADRDKVVTWAGDVVSDDVTIIGRSITFRANGKTFHGVGKPGESVFFRRIV